MPYFSLDMEINLNFPPYLPYAPTYQWFKNGTEVPDNDPRFQNPFTRGYDYSIFTVYNAQPSDSVLSGPRSKHLPHCLE